MGGLWSVCVIFFLPLKKAAILFFESSCITETFQWLAVVISLRKQIVQSPFFAYTVTSIITFNLVVLGHLGGTGWDARDSDVESVSEQTHGLHETCRGNKNYWLLVQPTWRKSWKITIFSRRYISKRVFFRCEVSFRGSNKFPNKKAWKMVDYCMFSIPTDFTQKGRRCSFLTLQEDCEGYCSVKWLEQKPSKSFNKHFENWNSMTQHQQAFLHSGIPT